MALEVYYPQDIRNALLAARQAALATAAAGDVSAEYVQGYADALTTIALAFGLTAQPEPARAWLPFALALDR